MAQLLHKQFDYNGIEVLIIIIIVISLTEISCLQSLCVLLDIFLFIGKVLNVKNLDDLKLIPFATNYAKRLQVELHRL